MIGTESRKAIAKLSESSVWTIPRWDLTLVTVIAIATMFGFTALSLTGVLTAGKRKLLDGKVAFALVSHRVVHLSTSVFKPS